MLRYSRRVGNLFDACYVLNLDRRTDRWAHTQAQIKKARLTSFLKPGVHVMRVSGVDGSSLDLAALHQQGVLTDMGYQRLQLPTEDKLFGMDLTPGAVGCAMGHRRLWQRIVEQGHQAALVLEDDVEFHPRLRRLLPDLWPRVPADWGLVYFGGLDLLSRGKPPRPYVAEGVRRAYQGHRELTAYVLHASSAKRCLALSEALTWQIDTHICSHVKHEEAAADEYLCDPMSYVFQPALAIQITAMGTDVQKQPSANSSLEDASRRMREFTGGETSIR